LRIATLAEAAAELAQPVGLFGGFDAYGDDRRDDPVVGTTAERRLTRARLSCHPFMRNWHIVHITHKWVALAG